MHKRRFDINCHVLVNNIYLTYIQMPRCIMPQNMRASTNMSRKTVRIIKIKVNQTFRDPYMNTNKEATRTIHGR